MKTVEELQAELAELEGRSQQTETSEADQIADDDPGLAVYMANPSTELLRFFPDWKAATLPEAKSYLAAQRERDRLVATIADETNPWDERIQAARELYGDRSYWGKDKEVEIIERYTPHPYAERLQELSEFTWDEAPAGVDWYEQNRSSVGSDWKEYIRSRHAAFEEFERLRNLFPQRQVKLACKPEAVACRVIIGLGIESSRDARFYGVFDYVRNLKSTSSKS